MKDFGSDSFLYRNGRRSHAWSLSDLFVLTTGFVATALYCYYVSHNRILWSDEIFGWLLVTDPSWTHMLSAWRLGVDGGGFAFYTLCKLWLLTFGPNYLNFRAFSAAGCFLGLVATWRVLQFFYPDWIAACCVFAVWFGSKTILWQMVQNRFYGLLLGACALAFCSAISTSIYLTGNIRKQRSLLALAIFANILLVETHPFGVLYSAAIVTGCLLSDWVEKRKRFGFYVASVGPWFLLLFSRQAMVNSAKVGKPWFWTVRPTKQDLLSLYQPHWIPHINHRLVVIGTATLFLLLWPAARRSLVRSFQARHRVLLPALALTLVPIPVFLLSQHGTSYFVDRYLIGFLVGVAVLIAEVCTQVHDSLPNQTARFTVLGVCLAFLLFSAGQTSRAYGRDLLLPPLDFTPRLASMLPSGLPIVFERPDEFDIMVQQQGPAHPDLLFLLDWSYTTEPTTPRGLVAGYHQMENLKIAGYLPDSVQQAGPFLAGTNRFVLVHDDGFRWMQERLSSPGWRCTKINDFKQGFWSATIWLVERQP